MDIVDKLWAIEQIKQLKARYFRFADTRQNEAFLDVFTDDVSWTLYAQNNVDVIKVINSKAEYASWVESLAPMRTAGYSVHHGHMPEITILDEDHATGVWAMMDYLNNPGGSHYVGYGHYHEEYRRGADGQWRIAKVVVTRLHIDPLGSADYVA